jgi:TRAP-type C4-dicarboxylate transport system permease small subunit
LKIINFIKNVTKVLCILLLFLIVGTTFFQVIVRYLFNFSFPWVEEMAIWSMVWIVFLGSVLAIIEVAHPKIDFLINLLPKRIGMATEIFTNLVSAFVVTILVYYTLPLIKLNANNISPGIQLPKSIFYYSLVIGGSLMVLFFLAAIYAKVKMFRKDA